ncbi:MAG: hypothetical protein MJY57_01135 [Bacteroidales bacterium]|nr:hypothetical protein [Bacteroidales bacterium]
MEEKKLHPVRFCAIEDKYIWGSETFCCADLGYRDSVVAGGWLGGNTLSEIMETYMDRVTGENVYNFYGRQFPICIRRIRCKGKMPLRVHPGDELAAQRYDFLGKEKLWYIASAGKDASVMIGFRKQSDAGEFYDACLDGSVDGILNTTAVHAGECFRIAPGTVHCACGDVEILEVAESSPLDFCLCAWGEDISEEEFDTSLSLVEALDFIDYAPWKAERCDTRDGIVRKLVDIEQFCVSWISLTDALKISGGENPSFVLYHCLNGAASVQIDVLGKEAAFRMKAGETLMVPAECGEFLLVPEEKSTDLLECVVPPREEKDSYLN